MARNKRLHVEMALIRLCYLQQAVTLVSDDSTGEVSKKKLVPDGSLPQKLRAPAAQPVTVKTVTEKTATTGSIAAAPAARLTVETTTLPDKPVASSTPPPATHTAPEPAATTQSPAKPTPAAAPSQIITATPVAAPVSTPHQVATATAAKLTGLAAMKQAMAARHHDTTEIQSIPLTLGAIHVYWEEFIDLYRQASKMTVVSNLQLAQLKLVNATEVGIVSRNIVQFRFMEEEKLVIADFLKKKFNNPHIVLTLQLDESQQTQDIGPAPLSSREQFQQMTEKYPLVKELKDRLNMELDF